MQGGSQTGIPALCLGIQVGLEGRGVCLAGGDGWGQDYNRTAASICLGPGRLLTVWSISVQGPCLGPSGVLEDPCKESKLLDCWSDHQEEPEIYSQLVTSASGPNFLPRHVTRGNRTQQTNGLSHPSLAGHAPPWAHSHAGSTATRLQGQAPKMVHLQPYTYRAFRH